MPKRTMTFSQKEIEQLVMEKARADAPKIGGAVTVSSSISPGYEDRFTHTSGSYSVTVTFDDAPPKKGGG